MPEARYLRLGSVSARENQKTHVPIRWVVRRSVDGYEAAPPMRCLADDTIAAEPGLRSVAECVAILLEEGERCEGVSDKRPVRKFGQLVGYIEISREYPEFLAS
jgi:hypothetical protein